MRRGSALLLCCGMIALGAVACSDQNKGDPNATGNQPICVEARGRVSAICKGATLPSFDSTCAEKDHCRAGCIYDNPCDGGAQTKCMTERGC